MTFEENMKNIKGRIREAVYIGKKVKFYSSVARFRNEVTAPLLCKTEYFKCVYSITTLYIYCYSVVNSNGMIDTEYDNSVVAAELTEYYNRLVDYIETPRRCHLSCQFYAPRR